MIKPVATSGDFRAEYFLHARYRDGSDYENR